MKEGESVEILRLPTLSLTRTLQTARLGLTSSFPLPLFISFCLSILLSLFSRLSFLL